MSRLIVNADDLGFTEGINDAVASLAQQRALSSATAMARGAALDHAVLCRFPPQLGIGCHVVLVDGLASAPPGRTVTLGNNGIFRPQLSGFAVAAVLHRLSASEIEAEARAQIRSLQMRGLTLTHVDTHKHTHLFPTVLRPVLRAAKSCGIERVRNPFEPQWARVATTGAPLVRRAQLLAFDRYRATFLREVDAAGMRTTAGALGVLATGSLNEDSLDRLLHALAEHGSPDACYELVCHPGIHDASLDSQRTRLRAERQRELSALAALIPRWTSTGAPHRLVNFASL